MEGADLELACLCGSENFDRVVVQRRPHGPVVTDFVACVGCRAMYFAPVPSTPLPARRPDGKGVGGPATTPDVDAAAQAYRKPGRSPPLKPGGRR